MTVLGIDYGTRRIGLALGESETGFAFPYRTLEQGSFSFSQLKSICRKESVVKIIIGLPQIWHVRQTLTEDIKRFATTLRVGLTLPVEFVEEAFTSKLARTLSPAKAQHSTHAQAATLILENYFIKARSTKHQIRNSI